MWKVSCAYLLGSAVAACAILVPQPERTILSPAGAFVLSPEFYKDKSGNVLLEICELSVQSLQRLHQGRGSVQPLHARGAEAARAAGKEYAKADSRYATRDSCVVGIEALAMLMGPLSFLCVYGIATRQPWRHTLQMLVSMGQLYGDLLYFMSARFDGADCASDRPGCRHTALHGGWRCEP